MKLHFEVNPYYLIVHSIERAYDNKPFPQWVRLVKKLKSKPYFLFGDKRKIFARIKNTQDLKIIFKKTESIFSKILQTKEFRRLLKETESYRDWVEKEWNKNKNTVLSTLKDITGLDFPNKKITVIITHPKLFNGSNIPEENVIFWGHREDWKNYTIVYLCHELLHIMVHKKYKNNTLMHALIELATDNELRIRLNGKGKYFKEGNYKVGHPTLRKIERKILPIWKKYLKGELKAKDIISLEKTLHNSNILENMRMS